MLGGGGGSAHILYILLQVLAAGQLSDQLTELICIFIINENQIISMLLCISCEPYLAQLSLSPSKYPSSKERGWGSKAIFLFVILIYCTTLKFFSSELKKTHGESLDSSSLPK